MVVAACPHREARAVAHLDLGIPAGDLTQAVAEADLAMSLSGVGTVSSQPD